MANDKFLVAAAARPLPKRDLPVELFVSIMNGAEGVLEGCDVWELIRLVPHIREMPLVKPVGGFTYNAWLLYLSDDDGVVTPYEVRPAEWCKAPMVRQIVGYGSTCWKTMGLRDEERLPTPSELAERFWLDYLPPGNGCPRETEQE